MRHRLVAGVIVLVVAGLASPGCGAPPETQIEPPPAAARRVADPPPVPNCSPAAGWSFLVRDSQNCWYHTPHGRWRVVNHEMHYDVLVARVMAEHLDVAEDVGRRFVEAHRERYREIVIFVVAETEAEPPPIRRVTWTRSGGFEYLDFA